jgi:hypothetical protein
VPFWLDNKKNPAFAGLEERGPYGIRTRAAAVRGRCPRPLDEWAVAGAQVSGYCVADRSVRDGSDGFRLARVELRLEVASNRLAVGEHGVIADATGWQLHDPDVVVAVAVTARVRSSLIEWPKAVALPLSPHVPRTPIRSRGRAKPTAGAQVCSLRRKAAEIAGLRFRLANLGPGSR